MTITLTNVSQQQLEAIKKNFERIIERPAEVPEKYDVLIPMENQTDCWRLFFAGADYCLNKFGKHYTT